MRSNPETLYHFYHRRSFHANFYGARRAFTYTRNHSSGFYGNLEWITLFAVPVMLGVDHRGPATAPALKKLIFQNGDSRHRLSRLQKPANSGCTYPLLIIGQVDKMCTMINGSNWANAIRFAQFHPYWTRSVLYIYYISHHTRTILDFLSGGTPCPTLHKLSCSLSTPLAHMAGVTIAQKSIFFIPMLLNMSLKEGLVRISSIRCSFSSSLLFAKERLNQK